MEAGTGHLRIGELSRRTGVAPGLLRAWERRYGLLRPARSEGGFRLYSEADERRVELMRQHLRAGLAAAEAARLARDDSGEAVTQRPEDGRPQLEAAALRLRAALDSFDEMAAQQALDDVFGAFTVEAVLRGVVLPYLSELGERWSSGEASVGQEHFATNVLRGRLLGLARGWGGGDGPRALLACAPGELHDLGLISFGVALRLRGWRITFLGTDTPTDTLVSAAHDLRPDLVVVTATTTRRLTSLVETLRRLNRESPVAIAGAGATPAIAAKAGVRLLEDDPVGATAAIA